MEEVWCRLVGGPGCFGTGPLAASACSEVPPCPPGTTSRLNFTFSPFPRFCTFHTLGLTPVSSQLGRFPLHSLSLHRPNCLAGWAGACARRGGRQTCILRSHWSKSAAAVLSLVAACRCWCLGRGGDWLQLWRKGCLQKSSRYLQKSASVCPADFRLTIRYEKNVQKPNSPVPQISGTLETWEACFANAMQCIVGPRASTSKLQNRPVWLQDHLHQFEGTGS